MMNMPRMVRIAAMVITVVAGAGAEPFSLTLMTFNIRYGSANDGDNSWDKRRDLVADTIRRSMPEVVGTQETLEFQAAYLASQLPEYRRFGMGRDADGTGERMEVFYRADALSPVETGNFWYSFTPDTPGTSEWESACNRMATWAKFYHHASKTFLVVFNTHFDHVSEEARRNSARILSERIKSLPESSAVFVLGDFNSKAEDSTAWDILTGAGLRDAWVDAARREGPETTWSGFAAPEVGAKRRIDWILYRGSGVRVESCETVIHNEAGRYPSDHYPVKAGFTVDN